MLWLCVYAGEYVPFSNEHMERSTPTLYLKAKEAKQCNNAAFKVKVMLLNLLHLSKSMKVLNLNVVVCQIALNLKADAF